MSTTPHDQNAQTDWKFWLQLTVDVLAIVVPIVVALMFSG